MTDIVQEKFQVNYPEVPEGNEGQWATDKSARTKKGLQTRAMDGRYESYNGDFYTSLPPGTDIRDQEVYDDSKLPLAGCLGSGTQVTEDVTRESVVKGFDTKRLLQTDDEYTREHNDAFYDDVGGFVERNNMLDRM